jgi:hypothetical protein
MKDVMKEVFWLCLGIMKNILSLAEFKLGKDTADYKYFKKEVMDYFYNGLTKFYENLEAKKILKKCSCNSKLRQGYNPCTECGGSGYTTE